MSVGPRPHATRSPSELANDPIADGNSNHRVTTASLHLPSRSDPQSTARVIVGPPPWLQATQNEKKAHEEVKVQKKRNEADETPQSPVTSTRRDATDQNKTETALQSRSGAHLGPLKSVPGVQPTAGYIEAGLTSLDLVAARGVGRTSPGMAATSAPPTASSVQHSLSKGDVLDTPDEPIPDRYWDELPSDISKEQAILMWNKKRCPFCPRCVTRHPPPHGDSATVIRRERRRRRKSRAQVRKHGAREALREQEQQPRSQSAPPP